MMTSYVGGWLLFGLLCVVFELISPGFFYCLSIALGTLPAAVGAWFELSVVMQSVLFFLGSLVSFYLLYVCVRKNARSDGHYKSVVDALPGKRGIVVEKLSRTDVGQVRVDGQLWSAQPLHEESIEKGSTVIVLRVEGVRLIVRNDTQG